MIHRIEYFKLLFASSLVISFLLFGCVKLHNDLDRARMQIVNLRIVNNGLLGK